MTQEEKYQYLDTIKYANIHGACYPAILRGARESYPALYVILDKGDWQYRAHVSWPTVALNTVGDTISINL